MSSWIDRAKRLPQQIHLYASNITKRIQITFLVNAKNQLKFNVLYEGGELKNNGHKFPIDE